MTALCILYTKGNSIFPEIIFKSFCFMTAFCIPMEDKYIKLGLLQQPYLSECIGLFVFVSNNKTADCSVEFFSSV